jgi:pimeloyl-ACP methyl ester carboxylesterase
MQPNRLYTLTALVVTLVLTTTGACSAPQEAPVSDPIKTPAPGAAPAVRSGRAEINGVRYYYEVHGQGSPVLMLHGGFGSIGMFEPGLPAIAEHHQVLAVDLQGHGRTPLGDRKTIDPIDIANDLAVLLDQLGYDKVDVIGYSFGGAIAIRLAVQHPAVVRKLVVVSAGFAQDGFYPDMLPQQAQVSAAIAPMMKETPMYTSYVAVAPNPDEFPTLLDRMGEWMRRPYDWSADVKKLTMPVMLVYGDSDMIRLDHAVAFYRLLGGAQKDAAWKREHMSPNRLAILPDVTHYEMHLAPALPKAVLPFLDGTGGAPGGK